MPWAVRTAAAVGGLDLSVLRALQGSGDVPPTSSTRCPRDRSRASRTTWRRCSRLLRSRSRRRSWRPTPASGCRACSTASSRNPGPPSAGSTQLLQRVLGAGARAVLGAGARTAGARHPLPGPPDGRRRAGSAVRRPRPAGELVRRRSDGREEAGATRTASRVPALTRVMELDERGLLLIPSVFAWPKVLLVTAEPWQPTVIYPARGVGMLWDGKRSLRRTRWPSCSDATARRFCSHSTRRARPASWRDCSGSPAVASPSSYPCSPRPGSSPASGSGATSCTCAPLAATRSSR